MQNAIKILLGIWNTGIRLVLCNYPQSIRCGFTPVEHWPGCEPLDHKCVTNILHTVATVYQFY